MTKMVELEETMRSDRILAGERIAFIGKLGSINRREAATLVRDHGGVAVDANDPEVSLIVIGADELPLEGVDTSLDRLLRDRVAEGACRTWTETELWQHLGLFDGDSPCRQLYTPVMLAQLANVSVSTIRRWHRRGLIVPAREVRRLPYFDYQEVATARRIAGLIASGTSPKRIENKLVQLAQIVEGAARPLAQLSVIVEGRDVLLRRGEGLVEPGGQKRIDFDSFEPLPEEETATVVPFAAHSILESGNQPVVDLPGPRELLDQASRFEEEGQLDEACEALRSWLISSGPSADICFQLAELLYRVGDYGAARERYFMAIELDEEYVEARANLGCLLAEMGDRELALAALRGALRFHPDYPDVHFHLGRLLDDLGSAEEATDHWRKFLELSPESPWCDEARHRLGEPAPEIDV